MASDEEQHTAGRTEGWLTTPRAILLGAVVIGGFAYAGLRERGGATQAVGAPTPSAAPVTVDAPTAQPPSSATPVGAPPVATPTAVPTASASDVAADAARALAPHLAKVRAACWVGRPKEAKVRLVMNYSFDATGKQIVRGVSEPRLDGDQRAWVVGLGACVQLELPEIQVTPPGTGIQVEVPIDFP